MPTTTTFVYTRGINVEVSVNRIENGFVVKIVLTHLATNDILESSERRFSSAQAVKAFFDGFDAGILIGSMLGFKNIDLPKIPE